MSREDWKDVPPPGAVYGDQVNQYGSFNIGKMVNGADQRQYAPATRELIDLINQLGRAGMVSSAGEVLNPRQAEAHVMQNRSRLQGLVGALRGGAWRVLLDGVESAAGPAVLDLVRSVLVR